MDLGVFGFFGTKICPRTVFDYGFVLLARSPIRIRGVLVFLKNKIVNFYSFYNFFFFFLVLDVLKSCKKHFSSAVLTDNDMM